MIAGLFFTFGFTTVLLVANALRAPVSPDRRFAPLWLPAMIASEMAGVWLTLTGILAALAVVFEIDANPIGRLGLWGTGIAFLGQLIVWRRSHAGARAVGALSHQPPSLLHRTFSWPYQLPRSVTRDEVYFATNPTTGEPLRLDMYRPIEVSGPLPLIIHVHGGGWRGGHPRQASQTMLHHLARSGWAVASIEYPLSPAATFPDHLFGIDKTIEWSKSQSDIAGPTVLLGNSAGAHLAAVAALTRPDIAACIAMYGIFDFLNRNRTRHNWPLIPRVVMKAEPEDAPDRYRAASPLDLVHAEAPPFLMIHGTYDSLVMPEESHVFAGALSQVGVATTVIEVPWGQHGFDTLGGPRARATAVRVSEWLTPLLVSESTPSTEASPSF